MVYVQKYGERVDIVGILGNKLENLLDSTLPNIKWD